MMNIFQIILSRYMALTYDQQGIPTMADFFSPDIDLFRPWMMTIEKNGVDYSVLTAGRGVVYFSGSSLYQKPLFDNFSARDMRTLKNLLQHCLSKKVAGTYSAECQFNLWECFRMTALILPLRDQSKDIHHAAIILSITECEPSSTLATTPHQKHHRLIEEQCLNIGFGDSDYYSMIPYSTLIEKAVRSPQISFSDPLHSRMVPAGIASYKLF